MERAKASAFGAAAAFLFTFLVSIMYQIRDARRLSSVEYRGVAGAPRPENPFLRGSAYRDYDPVDTDTPDEFAGLRGTYS